MEEVVLSDDLVIALSEQINITLYPVSHFAIDLGFDSAAASVAEELAIQKQHPHGKYEHLLHKFVATHGRGAKAAQVLIDIFKVKQKMLLVYFLEEAIEKQNTLKQSRRRQEPGHADGQGQIRTKIRPLNAGTSARDLRPSRSRIDWSMSEPLSQNTLQPSEQTPSPVNQPPPAGEIFSRNKSFSKILAGLCLIVLFLVIVTAYTWNNPSTEPGKCALSPCLNGGTCHELDGEIRCTCRIGYGGSNCRTELIAETFSLEECQDTLRKHYEKHLFDVRINPLDPDYDVDLKTLYTTVSLYKQDQNNIPDKSLQKSTLNGSVNDIFQTKVRGSLPERIVLFGEAGRGKTTAVAKMAYDWANKREDSPLKNVKLLFVFKMRNINAKTGISEAIITLLGKKYQKYQKQLEDYIDSHEKDIVMLFDGYDEFSGGLEKCRKNVSDVIDILCHERCRRCRVLVTSRPVRMKDFFSRKVYSKMVIEGYSQQHAIDFIDKFFLSNKKKGTELKKYLEKDIVTNEMIATPLFCTMVCTLWNRGYMNGNYTRTKLFDDIMKFLMTHLNAKDEREINQDLLSDALVSVGRVAYMKLSNKSDLNPLVFSEDDFSEVHGDNVKISFSLGLLTKNMKTDSDVIIHIEFFHKLAQEYSAGKYLANGLDEGKISTVGFSEVVFDLKEIFLFASGTSVLACRNILASLSAGYSLRFFFIDELYDYQRVNLDFISEAAETCAEESETHLTRYFEDGTFGLQKITASTVVGFEKLPRSVKEKITTIDISEPTSSPDLFVRLWNSMHTCIYLTHMKMDLDVPPIISPQMEPLYSVNSFTTAPQPTADGYVQIMMYLPNLRELIISCDISTDYYSKFFLTPDVFGRLWDQVNSSSLLSRLVLPIPANISFNLKHLTSIRVFETNPVKSVSSLAHVLTFLPKLNIFETELVQLDDSTEAFCELWKNFHTSPDLNVIRIPILSSWNIPCDLEPLRSVQEFSTLSSIHLPIILINMPNLQILKIFSDIEFPGFVEVWGVLHILHELHHLAMVVPETVPVSLLEPLWSVQTFGTHFPFSVEAFPIMLTRLPNISELFVSATNNYDRKITDDTYFDKVISAIIDGLVKNGVQLKVLNMTFGPYLDPSKTVSRDTVENFIKMLKTSGMMLQLQIISIDYCVFNESDLIEIIKSIREFTSIMILRIDCCLHSEGEVTRFAIQQGQPQEENQDINKSEQSGSLMLTLFYKDKFFCYVSVCGERRGTGAHPSNDKNKREEKYLLREMFFLLPKYVKLNDFSI